MIPRAIAVLIVWLIALAALAASNAQHKQINDGLPLVNADYEQCTHINPGPIDGPAPGKLRTDYRTRNGGTA